MITKNAESKLFRILKESAARFPDRTAIESPDLPAISYAKLVSHIQKIHQCLKFEQISTSTRLAVVIGNSAESVITGLAISFSAPSIVLNPALTETEFRQLLQRIQPAAVINEPQVGNNAIRSARNLGIPVFELDISSDPEKPEPAIRALTGFGRPAPSASLQDCAYLYLTSGTTEQPKLVSLTQRQTYLRQQAIIDHFALTERDRYLNLMPLFHSTGNGLVRAMLMVGGTVSCAPIFDPIRFIDWMDHFVPTWFSASPSMHQAILEQSRATGSTCTGKALRFVRSANAALDPELKQKLAEFYGVPVVEAYGMTETGLIATTSLDPNQQRNGSVGRIDPSEVAVMDATGNLLPSGKQGEIVVRGDAVFDGYQGTSPCENNLFIDNEWFPTGDRGYIDHQQFLYLTGRSKEIINRAGQNISPGEVEKVLGLHPAVTDAVCFPIPHQTLGEEVGAAVVLKPDVQVSTSEIHLFASEHLAHFKVPRQIRVVDKVPRGATGKPLRLEMAELMPMAADTSPQIQQAITLARTPLERIIARIWQQTLELDEVDIHSDFIQIGGDSIKAAKIVNEISQTLGIELPITTLLCPASVATLAAELEAQLKVDNGEKASF